MFSLRVNRMLNTNSPLITEFLKDHQQFSRLLFEISKLLESGKVAEAKRRAVELDSLAGPHIEYEEAELYPRLAQLGETSVTEQLLVGEHHSALDAVRALCESEGFTDEELLKIRQGIADAISHAEHCGSLISLMSRLDAQQQAESLDRLKQFRIDGKKWTEL